jgi:flagellar export protein FliJ
MKFRLQRVLELRCGRERLARHQLALRQLDYQQALEGVERLQVKENTLFSFVRGQDGSAVSLPLFQCISAYFVALRGEIAEQEERQHKALGLLEEQREILRRRWKERRMLEILRDRWAAALKEMMDREEQKQIDEQVLFSFQGSGESRKRRNWEVR